VVEVALEGLRQDQLDAADVKIRYDAPAASFGTYLARSKIDASWLGGGATTPPGATTAARGREARIPSTLMDEPATVGQRKAWALTNLAHTPFEDKRDQGELKLYDDGTHGDRVAHDGVFSADAPELRFEGVYRYAGDVAIPSNGVAGCINRSLQYAEHVALGVSPELIAKAVVWKAYEPTLLFDRAAAAEIAGAPASGHVRTAAIVTPQDRFGNLLGPGHASDVAFRVEKGKPVGPVIDNWDGSYVQVVEHARDTKPSVVVTANGVASGAVEPGGPPVGEGDHGIPRWVWYVVLLLVLVAIVLYLLRS
jgi:hypothetical protein